MSAHSCGAICEVISASMIVREIVCGSVQAGRIIANLIVAGGGVLIRAAAQAYRQALVSKSLSLGMSRTNVSALFSAVIYLKRKMTSSGYSARKQLRDYLSPWSFYESSSLLTDMSHAGSRADAQRQGVTQETLKNATRARQMTVEEAEKILGIEKNMNYDEVLRVSLQLSTCSLGNPLAQGSRASDNVALCHCSS